MVTIFLLKKCNAFRKRQDLACKFVLAFCCLIFKYSGRSVVYFIAKILRVLVSLVLGLRTTLFKINGLDRGRVIEKISGLDPAGLDYNTGNN